MTPAAPERVRLVRVRELLAGAPTSGKKILVDRLWPRGVARERLPLDAWLPQVAPSPALRRWFGHDPARFPEFARRYRAELAANSAAKQLRETLRDGPITLLYDARDSRHNHAVVLAQWLLEGLQAEESGACPD